VDGGEAGPLVQVQQVGPEVIPRFSCGGRRARGQGEAPRVWRWAQAVASESEYPEEDSQRRRSWPSDRSEIQHAGKEAGISIRSVSVGTPARLTRIIGPGAVAKDLPAGSGQCGERGGGSRKGWARGKLPSGNVIMIESAGAISEDLWGGGSTIGMAGHSPSGNGPCHPVWFGGVVRDNRRIDVAARPGLRLLSCMVVEAFHAPAARI